MWRRNHDGTHVTEVIPPRSLAGGMAAARAMVAALAGDRLTLELLLTSDGPRWYLRADDGAALGRATAQLRAAHPQALLDRPARDLGRARSGESSATVVLRPLREAALPLRFDWAREHDPLAGLAAAARPLADERVVCRLTLAPAGAREADRVRRRCEAPRAAVRPAPVGPSLAPLVAALGVGAAGLQGWRWYEAGEWPLLAAGSAAGLVGLPLLLALATRLMGSSEPLPARTLEARLDGPLMRGRLEVVAIGPDRRRGRALARQVASAYAAYDDPAGGGVRAGRARGRPLLLNPGEVAALWHLPEAGAVAGARRATAQRLPTPPGHAASGLRIGANRSGGTERPVYLPAPLAHRNHFIVAKTRRGKSTLLRHLAAGVMQRVAEGSDDSALVVVDPHQDLAEAVLASVPDALSARTVYLDFAHLERPVGLNLIDVALFPDRDRTVEGIVTIMNRLWPDNWGPRMEGALRASLAVLHEANTRRPREEQFTLLDVAPLLTDDAFRRALLDEVEDPAVEAWWKHNYERAGLVLRQQTANPVTSKIGRFTVTEASRFVLGQARSTFDPRQVLREGGVLVVNTAVGTLGEGAASLVGATMLNLLGLLVEEQVALPEAQRRRMVELVDESSTLGAVDYGRMLSELGKYGASFTLVTQSLSKLDAVDPLLVPTILSNCDGLTAFQTSAEDATRLLPELGGELEVEDLVSLDDFTCYARWWDGHGRPPAFTVEVDPPPAADLERAASIARRSAARYGRARALVVEEVGRSLRAHLPKEAPVGESVAARGARDKQAAGGQRGEVGTAEPSGQPSPSGHADVAVDTAPESGAAAASTGGALQQHRVARGNAQRDRRKEASR